MGWIHTELVSFFFCLSEKAFVDHHCLCTMDGVRCVDSLAAGVAPHNSFRTLGPTLLISMAYLDLGKWLVTLESGYRFGYDLVLLMLCFNLSAILWSISQVVSAWSPGRTLQRYGFALLSCHCKL